MSHLRGKKIPFSLKFQNQKQRKQLILILILQILIRINLNFDKLSAQHSRFLKMFKQLRLEIGLKDALVEMPKFNKWLSSLLRNKGKLEEIAITTVNAECSAIIMNKISEKLEDPGKFLIPCALQELNRTSALTVSGASINLLPHSIYKQLGLEALTPTRMTLELANRSITHPMGIAEDVVVRVDGFTFLADFVVVNFEPDLRVPIILGRPFLRTAKSLLNLYEETLTLRVGKEELMIRLVAVPLLIMDNPSPSSSPVKTSDNLEKFADELAPLDSLPSGNDDSTLKKDLHEENFQVYSNPLFDKMEEDVKIKNSNVSDEPVSLNIPLSNKVECFAQEDNNDEIDAFLAMEVSSNFEEGYFDSEGYITFLDILLSDNASHNLASEFVGELLTLPSRNDREFGEYLSLMTVLCEISTFQSQENVHANQRSVIESLPVSPIPVEDSVENDDSEDKDNELPNLDHQDDPSIPRPPPEPPDVEKCLEPEAGFSQQILLKPPQASGPIDYIPEANMPLWKKARFTAPTSRFKVGEGSAVAAAARQARHALTSSVDYGFIDTVDASIRASESKAMTAVREMDVSVLQRLRIDDGDRQTSHIQHEHDRIRGNGDDSHDSGSGRRTKRTTRECNYSDFLKCQPCNFKGTKGIVGLTQWFEKMESVFHISNCTVACQIKFATCTLQGNALTWWNSHVKTVGHEVKGTDVLSYNQRFQELALMCSRMFPEESDEVEKYLGGLPDMIQGSVMAYKPKTMQDAIEFATELMDQKIRTFADRLAKNKRKLDDNSRSNQNQQQPLKRQNVARAYTAGPKEKKVYGGSKPLCLKCNYHHDGKCCHTPNTTET
ncbi:putative reverse transcriptase domain-containing protein [Tanacetum coccineum]